MADPFRAPANVIAQDWTQLGAHLAAHGMTLGAETPRQFAGGLANLNYLIVVDGREVVLRRPPMGKTAEGASDMAREHRVLSRLQPLYPLAPGAVHFCDDVAVLGAPFQLLEYRAGQPIGGTLPDELCGKIRPVANVLVDAMARLHAIDPAALVGLGKPEGFLKRQVDGWTRRSAAAYPDGDAPASLEVVLASLRARLPASSRTSLLHNDFKLDNILFDFDALRAVAVVDWDMATLGDPLFDLGIFLAYWVEPGDPDIVKSLHAVPSLEPGAPTRRELANAYFAAANIEPVPLDFYFTIGRLRLAIAWLQLYRLHQRGALVGEHYASFGELSSGILGWTANTLEELR